MANDFTEEPIKYILQAKDFYRIIYDLQEHIDLLYQRCGDQLGRIKYLEDRVLKDEPH
jgi:hypothetical protein